MALNDHLYDEVSKVAFDLHVRRGRVHGYDIEDWLEAERIVMERHRKGPEHESDIMDGRTGKAGVKAKPKTAKESQNTQEKSSSPRVKKAAAKRK